MQYSQWDSEGTLSKEVYHEKRRIGQHSDFHSLVPLSTRRSLVKCLSISVYQKYFEDTLVEELKKLVQFQQTIDIKESSWKNIVQSVPKPTIHTVERKRVLIRLPFSGDNIEDYTHRHLCDIIKRVYNTTELQAINTCRTIVPLIIVYRWRPLHCVFTDLLALVRHLKLIVLKVDYLIAWGSMGAIWIAQNHLEFNSGLSAWPWASYRSQ